MPFPNSGIAIPANVTDIVYVSEGGKCFQGRELTALSSTVQPLKVTCYVITVEWLSEWETQAAEAAPALAAPGTCTGLAATAGTARQYLFQNFKARAKACNLKLPGVA